MDTWCNRLGSPGSSAETSWSDCCHKDIRKSLLPCHLGRPSFSRLLHRQQASQDEGLNLVEELIHRRDAVQPHQVKLELPDVPLSAKFLVVAFGSFLRQRALLITEPLLPVEHHAV